MTTRLLTALLLISITPAVAQTVVDGTDAGIDRALIQGMMSEITEGEANPGAAAFRGLVLTDVRVVQTAAGTVEARFLCGFVNLGGGKGDSLELRFFYNTVNGAGSLYSEDRFGAPENQALLDRRFEESGCRAALTLDHDGKMPAKVNSYAVTKSSEISSASDSGYLPLTEH